MKVNPGHLAAVLKKTASAISMATGRDKLNKAVGGLIDLEDLKNFAWIKKRLPKEYQQCEKPHQIFALFQATPITENEKNGQDNQGKNKADSPPEGAGNGQLSLDGSANVAAETPENAALAAERDKIAIESSANSRAMETAKLKDLEAKAILSEIKADEERRKLVKVNPFGRMLFNIVAAMRTQILNAIPSIAQVILDEVKSALIKETPDAEILMAIQKLWQSEISKIFIAIDKELKNKLRQIKRKLKGIDTPDDSDDTPDNISEAA